MKKIALFATLLVTFAACANDSPPQPPAAPVTRTGVLQVFVEFDGKGVPGVALEIVGTDQRKVSDENGMAEFTLPAGKYVLHADVNRPGPSLGRDYDVTVRPNETTRLDAFDCLVCV